MKHLKGISSASNHNFINDTKNSVENNNLLEHKKQLKKKWKKNKDFNISPLTSNILEISEPRVIGPGGTPLPRLSDLPNLVNKKGEISIICFTWNIASQSTNCLCQLNTIFAKMPQQDRPDVIGIALQELPTSTISFHRNIVEVISNTLKTTHQIYCWVRKWSQILIILIRKPLSQYASQPEYQFVASSIVAKPFRTKGAIAIGFRLLQTSCILISCHLTHGKLKSRIADYEKISKSLDFKFLRENIQNPIEKCKNENKNNCKTDSSNKKCKCDQPMKRAANIFWFGDLNFRIKKKQELKSIETKLKNRAFRNSYDYKSLLEYDQLNIERIKGGAFNDFQEGKIGFAPTHKFSIKTSNYSKNRIPSYTDRVLYWNRDEKNIIPIRYDCVWDVNTSDHKPVYCIFEMGVIDKQIIKNIN